METETSPSCPVGIDRMAKTADGFVVAMKHAEVAIPVPGRGCIPCTIAAIGKSNGDWFRGKPLWRMNGVEADG